MPVQAKEEPAFFQARLSIGQPGDKYEQEADQMADAVANPSRQPLAVKEVAQGVQKASLIRRMAESGSTEARAAAEEKPLQRQAEEEEEQMQRKPTGPLAAPMAGPQLSRRIKASSGRGKPMDKSIRAEMEQSFGRNFSDVSIHTGQEAEELSKALGAQAFTHGNDIYFNAGKYLPESNAGKHLLAHELTHVVQQKGGKKIQRKKGSKASLTAARFKNNAILEAALQGSLLIRKGAEGEHVTILQKALIDEGFTLPKYGVDGKFGDETKKAVWDYQVRYDLGKDGIVGPETMGHLDENFAKLTKTDRYDTWYQEQINLYKKESAFPFHVAVMNVFYKTRNFHVIQMLNDTGYDVYTFTGATDYWKHKDGRIEKKDLSRSLRGNTDRAKSIIRLNAKLKPIDAAMTLYHELNHVVSKEPDYLKQEIESRVRTEQFAIDNNLPPTRKEYRTKDGQVNVAFIEKEIRSSSHYNPTGKQRIKRTYSGMKKSGPWVVPG